MIEYGFNQVEIGLGDAWIDEPKIRTVLQGIKDVGATWVRVGVPWDLAETTQNNPTWTNWDRAFNLCAEYGLKVVAFVNVGPNLLLGLFGVPSPNMPAWASPVTYGNFCKALATRYGTAGTNQVIAIEIWNEQNNIAFFPQAKQPSIFAEYVKAAYTAIKSVHPTCTVITGGTMAVGTGWPSTDPVEFITGMYDAGVKDFCDAIGWHWYNNKPDFTDEPPSLTSTYWLRLLDLRALMVARNDSAKKIWITEFGVSHPPLDSFTARDQLKTMVDQLKTLTYLGPWFIYSYADHLGYTYGVVDKDFNKKQPIWDFVATIKGADTADITPPSAPTTLNYETVTANTVSLTWDAATDNIGVTGYRVYNFGAKIADVATLAYTAAGLTPGKLQSFYVTAVDAAGNESAASNTVTPTTSAPEGEQEFNEYTFTGTEVPAVFVPVGQGFAVTSGVARHNAASTNGVHISGGYYHRDQKSSDHYTQIRMSSDAQQPDRAAIAAVRYSIDNGDFVGAMVNYSGINPTADGAKIFTRIGGVLKVRNAKNANGLTSADDLRLGVEGNKYTAYMVTGGVVTELVTWVDQTSTFPGATNKRGAFLYQHIRQSGINHDAPGITGKFVCYDINPVQPSGTASDLWQLALADEDEWGELFGNVPWESTV